MSAQSVDILVIGDGVAARAFLWKLHSSHFEGSVLQVYENNLFPPTSFQSTGLVAFHGMKKGVSPLGDILCEGVEYFNNNVYGTGLMGLHKGKFYDFAKIDDDRLYRRYGKTSKTENKRFPLNVKDNYSYIVEDAVFIRPKLFMDSLLEQFNYPVKVDSMIELNGKSALFHSGETIKFNKLVLAAGISLKYFNKKKISEVAGSFLQWNKDLGEDSFAYGLGKCNLVYRAQDKCLMLGGTTQSDEIVSHDGNELSLFYQEASELLEFKLPDFISAEIKSGVRVKGPKRLPLFEMLSPDIFQLGAAYKNGWSQSFYGASCLINEVI